MPDSATAELQSYDLRVLGRAELARAGGRSVDRVLAQPKRLALLTFLAMKAQGAFIRRDALAAMFWPELGTTRARTALRHALHFLGKQLGRGVLLRRGADEVGVWSGAIRCDAVEFRTLLTRGDHEAALDLHRGELLSSINLAGAPGFEHWLDATRSGLQRAAIAAVDTLYRNAVSAGDRDQAIAWLHRWLELDPYDERAARLLAESLHRAGARAGAVEMLEGFTRRLARELELVPAVETIRLADRLRRTTLAEDDSGRAPHAHGHVTLLIPPLDVRGSGAPDGFAEALRRLIANRLDGIAGLRVLVEDASVSRHGEALPPGAGAGPAWRGASARATHTASGCAVCVAGAFELDLLVHDAAGTPIARATSRRVPLRRAFAAVETVCRSIATTLILGRDAALATTVANATTRFDAFGALLNGEHALRTGNPFGAIVAFEDAVMRDPDCAVAWYRLSHAASLAGFVDRAAQAAKEAMRTARSLPPLAAELIGARHDAWFGDPFAAERRLHALASSHRDQVEPLLELAKTIFYAGPGRGRPFTDAKPYFARVLEIRPDDVAALLHLARIHAYTGETAIFNGIAARITALQTGRVIQLEVRALRAGIAGPETDRPRILRDVAAAVDVRGVEHIPERVATYTADPTWGGELARSFLDAARDPIGTTHVLHAAARLAAARGRMVEAMETVDRLRALDPHGAAILAAELALLPHVDLDPGTIMAIRAELEAIAGPGDAAAPPASPDEARRLYLVGRLDIALGHVVAGERAATRLDSIGRAGGEDSMACRAWAAALRAHRSRMSGDVLNVLTILDGAMPAHRHALSHHGFRAHDHVAFRFDRARWLLEAGRTSEAERWLNAIPQDLTGSSRFSGAGTLLRADIAEARGDLRGAALEYERFARLWHDADPPLQPLVERATKRAASLRVRVMDEDLPLAGMGDTDSALS